MHNLYENLILVEHTLCLMCLCPKSDLPMDFEVRGPFMEGKHIIENPRLRCCGNGNQTEGSTTSQPMQRGQKLLSRSRCHGCLPDRSQMRYKALAIPGKSHAAFLR